MDSELLQSFVRSGTTLEEEEPSRLYQQSQPKDKDKSRKDRTDTPTPPPNASWGRRKHVVVIEQRKFNAVALALDECYCDKDRAASVSFGYMDIKQELKQKQTSEKMSIRIMPDDSDAMAFLMLGIREIKFGNSESGASFISKVFTSEKS